MGRTPRRSRVSGSARQKEENQITGYFSDPTLAGQHFGGGVHEVPEILLAQAGDIHAAVVGHVDMVAFAQLAHLCGADAEKGEHAALAGDETEIALRAMFLQL